MQMMTDVEEMANPMQTNQRASTWDSQLDKMLDNHASLTTGVWFFGETPLEISGFAPSGMQAMDQRY
jgi:hypothetical protein